MKRKKLINCLIRWWNRLILEEKIGVVMANIIAITLMIILFINSNSLLLVLGLSLIALIISNTLGILYFTVLVFLGEILVQVVKDKISK